MDNKSLAVNIKDDIDFSIEKDGGNEFRRNLKFYNVINSDAYRHESLPFRRHLGLSSIGEECKRKVWLKFRWCKLVTLSSKQIRLFNRGHSEEARFQAMLKTAGFEVYPYNIKTGKQFNVSYVNGHVGGSCDGFVRNYKYFKNEVVLTEFKTANSTSFNQIKKHGVKHARYEYYAQMQAYMTEFDCTKCLFFVVNKNNDEYLIELIELEDRLKWKNKIKNYCNIVRSKLPPSKAYERSSMFKCTMCEFKGICFFNEKPHVNCRSCEMCVIDNSGAWYCEQHNIVLSSADCLEPCASYRSVINNDE